MATLAPALTDAHDRVWLVGGARLAGGFLAADAIDERRVSITPILLGDGIELFAGSDLERRLHLLETTVDESGLVEVRYRIAGE